MERPVTYAIVAVALLLVSTIFAQVSANQANSTNDTSIGLYLEQGIEPNFANANWTNITPPGTGIVNETIGKGTGALVTSPSVTPEAFENKEPPPAEGGSIFDTLGNFGVGIVGTSGAPAQASDKSSMLRASTEAAPPPASESAPLRKNELATLLAIVVGVLMLAFIFKVAMWQVARQEQMQIHRMLGSESRMDILSILSEGEKNLTYISNTLGKSKATTVEHLDKLVKANLVEKLENPDRKFVFYRLSGSGKALIREGVVKKSTAISFEETT